MKHLTLRLEEDLWERLVLLAEREAKKLAEECHAPKVGNRSATARWLITVGLDAVGEEADG